MAENKAQNKGLIFQEHQDNPNLYSMTNPRLTHIAQRATQVTIYWSGKLMAKRYWQRCNLKDIEGSTEPERWKHQEPPTSRAEVKTQWRGHFPCNGPAWF